MQAFSSSLPSDNLLAYRKTGSRFSSASDLASAHGILDKDGKYYSDRSGDLDRKTSNVRMVSVSLKVFCILLP